MTARLFVFGSINLDLVTRVSRHPLPGETLLGEEYQMLAGGKGANQALAAALALNDAASGVFMAGAVGKDAFAAPALANLKKYKVDLSHTIEVEAGTGLALIAIDADGENTIIVCPGANALIKASQIESAGLGIGDILLTQQEGNLEEIWNAHRLAKQKGAMVIHNAAPAVETPKAIYENIDVLIVNESEALEIGKHSGLQSTSAKAAAKSLVRLLNANIILTLGEKGVVGFIDADEIVIGAPSVKVVDTTGAGDAFCGVFAASLIKGHDYRAALETSVNAASQACTRLGAQQV